MRARNILAVVAAVAAAAAITTTAGASSSRLGTSARADLSTAAAAASYLRSLGLDPAGFVIQRGTRNYAGPGCPGTGWNCTKARRVLQISTSSTDQNQFVCSPSSDTGPNDCTIVQTAAGSDNNAVCGESSSTPGVTQTCSISQTNTTGANNAAVGQNLTPSGDGSAMQQATVTQQNGTGANEVGLAQRIAQSSTQGGPSVSQSQDGSQSFTIKQTADSGQNKAYIYQSLAQSQTAPAGRSGSQSQTSNLQGHVDQTSTGLSTVNVSQNENQSQSAKTNGVQQTQTGPLSCCSSQTSNTGDTFKLTQNASQTQSPGGTHDDTESLVFTSTGSGIGTQTYNGQTATQSGSTIDSTQTCTDNDCTVVQPPPPPPPSTDIFVSVGNGQVNQYTTDGTYVQTFDDGSGSSETTGLGFDAAGNLYVTDWTASEVHRFTGAGPGSFGSGYANPESIVFDAAGNAYVGNASGPILEFGSTGTQIGSFAAASEDRGTDWIDLASDGCTIYYTSEGTSVKTFDVCTNQQGADFATGLPGATAYAIRLLPDGGALVADDNSIVRLDAGGSVVQQYNVPNETHFWFSLTLDGDGTSFWAGDPDTGDVVHFDIAGGNVLSRFNTGVSSANEAGGLAVRTTTSPVIG